MPKVSVIIPSYNYADYIAECIQSVLDQTYSDFEVIVVDDGSQDNTADVVRQFTDPRVRYLYQENRGLPGARNTGIKASSGELLAFLDSDDKFHPRKLEVQVAFLDAHPDVGLAYNSRYIVDSDGRILKLRRAPATVALKDLILGYPFAPSDVVIRRNWAFDVDLFDESFVLNSEDLNFHIRLQFAGCRFAGVPEALAYRKIHTGRRFRNIPGKLETYIRALNTAFEDSQCPQEVLTLRDFAYADHYRTWGFQAAVQQEAETAQHFFSEMMRLHPTMLDNGGDSLLHFFAHASTRDGGDHEPALRALFSQLPPDLAWLASRQDGVIARGYMIRGVRDIIWERRKAGEVHLAQAVRLGAQLDAPFLASLNDQLLNYEFEFGDEAASLVMQRLIPQLRQLGTRADVRQLNGTFAVNRVFGNYLAGKYKKVFRVWLQAIAADPKHLANRGVWSILLRSMVKLAG